jgi:hypothetical protein
LTLNIPNRPAFTVLCLLEHLVITPGCVFVQRVARTAAMPAHDRVIYIHPHIPTPEELAAVELALVWLRSWHHRVHNPGRPRREDRADFQSVISQVPDYRREGLSVKEMVGRLNVEKMTPRKLTVWIRRAEELGLLP